jgi:hypothetical protein
MKKFIIGIYFGIGLTAGIQTWLGDLTCEERKDVWCLLGLLFGIVFWPIAIVYYLINEYYNKNKEDGAK